MKHYQKHPFYLFLALLVLLLLLAACQSPVPTQEPIQATKEEIEEAEQPATATLVVTNTPQSPAETPEEEPATVPTATESVLVESALPPEPIPQTITTSDGVALAGQLFPAASEPAPLLVLFHWMGGDQKDWLALAPWLQNRGYQPELPDSPPPWLDPSWFPEMPADISFNVLTFTFRGCEGGCQTFNPDVWLLDAAAVMDHLELLEDVNFSQVATIGASIGADGAPYGCNYYNEAYGGCQGAFSLSPGGYLTPYPEAVDALGSEDPAKLAWCVYSTGDVPSANACENASGDHFRAISYPGTAHGMAILEDGQDPNPIEVILEFLSLTGLCADCP